MDLDGKRLALIGGAGLIGSHIVDQLVHEPVSEIVIYDNLVRGKLSNLELVIDSPKVRLVEASVTDGSTLRRELQGVDGVFLLAALWLGECVHDPRSAWKVNTMGTWNVSEACQDLGVKRLVYSSSASVYGDALLIPMDEDHPFNNRTTYGATKIASEQMLRAMNDQCGLPYVALRYFNVYGPRMDYEGTYVSVIMKVLDRIFAGQPPLIFGDGTQIYDFIYVSDIARANIQAMKADCVDEAFNVASGEGRSINDVVSILLELTGSSLTPEYRPEERSYVTRRIGGIQKAEKMLGFRSSVQLREGLRKVVEWRERQRSQ